MSDKTHINTVGGLSGAVYGSLVSAPALVALRPGLCAFPGCGAVRGVCVRSQGLFMFMYA